MVLALITRKTTCLSEPLITFPAFGKRIEVSAENKPDVISLGRPERQVRPSLLRYCYVLCLLPLGFNHQDFTWCLSEAPDSLST